MGHSNRSELALIGEILTRQWGGSTSAVFMPSYTWLPGPSKLQARLLKFYGAFKDPIGCRVARILV